MILRLHASVVLLVCTLKVITAQRSSCCETYCYNDDDERKQVRHFATKTMYEVIRPPDTDRQHIVPNCAPVKFWLLSRHGTRLPSKGDIVEMPTQLKLLQDAIIDNYYTRRTMPDNGRMCDKDLEILRNWRWDPNITAQYESTLTEQGWQDLKYLALRAKEKYWQLFGSGYDANKFLFRYTNTQRTEASFKAFAEGLFGSEESQRVKPIAPSEPDTLLKPYDYCADYDANKDRQKKDENSEANKFFRTALFTGTVWDISQRLGFRHNLSVEQIEHMWDACRFEQAWQISRASPFCAAFTQDQVNVLEYKEDLAYYYQTSYGYERSTELACHAMADMLKHLKSREEPTVVAYFTHDSQIQLLLAALGAKKDSTPPRADNYPFMKYRQYRSSDIPFAANIAAVKYQCAEQREPERVIFFLNEKPLMLDWCNVGLCNWSDVERKFQRFTDGNCDRMYCQGSGASQFFAHHSLITLVVGLFVLLSVRWGTLV
ncbi:multiple inositol polyphosphate phosphatase 1 [Anopheles ziemanni]|uniref:multiple inositol polyphosphate phosphatase 1 n=1 Tax=Anopheles coustani TaxID=139045 RepID=UPI002658733A|nr:multiple inositol polyphosphate phosphatase 1 [Anopheles coustani]XP_058171363.1 multiple inositol polyphosphate phosphatase 1 [Anopheles ziemanni]